MTYGFICPNCGRKENITMPITQYTSEGHLCPECNTEMQRDVSTLCVNSMKIAEVVQLPHHIIAGAIEAKCLHTARNSQIEK